MALNTLESRVRYRLSRSRDLVFTPMDFLDLSDRDQTGRVLRKLVAEQSLVRIARGLYAKTRKSSVTGKTIPAQSLPVLARTGQAGRACCPLACRTGIQLWQYDASSGRTCNRHQGKARFPQDRLQRQLHCAGTCRSTMN